MLFTLEAATNRGHFTSSQFTPPLDHNSVRDSVRAAAVRERF
jgi:hypothetical protein